MRAIFYSFNCVLERRTCHTSCKTAHLPFHKRMASPSLKCCIFLSTNANSSGTKKTALL